MLCKVKGIHISILLHSCFSHLLQTVLPDGHEGRAWIEEVEVARLEQLTGGMSALPGI